MTEFVSRNDYLSWGRVVRAQHQVARPHFADEIAGCVASGAGPLLAVGLRRSYGDSNLNSGGRLLDMSGLDRLVSFDHSRGILRAEAGISLGAILEVIVPKGWFLPTTPGTRFVTLGGAVANDVHGKNHHRAGSFGHAVRDIGLLRTDGTFQRLAPGHPLFAATVGGMGLTGIITDVTINLAPIASAYLRTERLAFDNVDAFFRIARESADAFEHTVAWIDCANTGPRTGRGVFQRSNWLSDGRLEPHGSKPGPSLPLDLPNFAINAASVRMFNLFYRQAQLAGPLEREEHYATSFYPLDAVGQWNRIYGSAGLYQYQCVVPPGAEAAIAEVIDVVARSGRGSFLAVLKTFGPVPSPGLISYPMEGANLAIDFANRGQKTLDVLSRLDEIVVSAGGRLYPAKDGRMPARIFQSGYPRWRELLNLKDPGIQSDFWRRVSAQ